MNLNLTTLSACILSLQFACGAHAYIPDLFKGADEGILKEAKKSLPVANLKFLLPSHRFKDLTVIKHLRFEGEYGTYKPELGLPFQMQGMDACEHGIFPQRALPALLQCLFPSPDGANLLANQVYGDILGTVMPKTMGALLRHVITFKGTSQKDSVQFQRLIYGTLMGLKENDVALNKNPSRETQMAFLRHDFGVSSAKAVKLLIEEHEGSDELPESFLEAFQSKTPLTALAKGKLLQKYLGKPLFEDGGLESFDNFQKGYSEYKALLKLESKSSDHIEKIRLFELHHRDKIDFETQRESLRGWGFADLLYRALEEEAGPQTFPYPPHVIERALMGYMWLKALNHQDVADFYGSLLNCEASQILPLLGQKFDIQAYRNLKGSIASSNPINQNSETLSALIRGFEMYDSTLPPLVQFSTAHFTPKDGKSRMAGKPFPDCVEASIENIVLITSRTKRGEGYVSEPRLLGLKAEAVEAFECDPEKIFSQEAHDVWGSFLSEIPGVSYLKPPKSSKAKYELRPGILNNLKVLASLSENKGEALKKAVQDAYNTETACDDDDGSDDESEAQILKDRLEPSLRALGILLSRKDTNVECRIGEEDEDQVEELEWKKRLKDFFGAIVFKINGRDTFKWEQDDTHSVVKYCPNAQDDWRKTCSLSGVVDKNDPMILSFLTDEKLESHFKGLRDEDVLDHFWSADLTNRDTLLTLLKVSLSQSHRSPWQNIPPIILKHLRELHDVSTDEKVVLVLIESIQNISDDKSQITLERIVKYLTNMPDVFGNLVSVKPDESSVGNTKSFQDDDENEDKFRSQSLCGYLFEREWSFFNTYAKENLRNLTISTGDQILISHLKDFKAVNVVRTFIWESEVEGQQSHLQLPPTTRFLSLLGYFQGLEKVLELIASYQSTYPNLHVFVNVATFEGEDPFDYDALEEEIEKHPTIDKARLSWGDEENIPKELMYEIGTDMIVRD